MERTYTERKVGSRFKMGGTLLEVVRTEFPSCEGCHFEKNGDARRDCIYAKNIGECRQLLRGDNANIIFKPIKNKKK